MSAVAENAKPRIVRVGRYDLHAKIASGGMAAVHIGRFAGPVGFNRTVAIKRLHPAFAAEPELVSMLIDEAHLAARIRHANVVQTLDTVTVDDEVFVVMEYVPGESLAALVSRATKTHEPITAAIASALVGGLLHGLHAAHEAKNDKGEPLEIVHRDVSPQNVLVGADGVARLIDFGVAKAFGRLQTTRDGQLKGKLAYMAPEQIMGKVSRRADVYAAGVILWELLTGRKLYRGDNEGEVLQQVLVGLVDPPSKYVPALSSDVDELVARALDREPEKRFGTAREMALELERAIRPALASEVGVWVEKLAGETLGRRASMVAEIEAAGVGEDDDLATGPDALAIAAGSRMTAHAPESELTSPSMASFSGPGRPFQNRSRNRTLLIASLLAMAIGALALATTRAFRTPDASLAIEPGVVASAASPAPSVDVAPPADPVASAPASASATATPFPRPGNCANARYFDKKTNRILYKRECLPHGTGNPHP